MKSSSDGRRKSLYGKTEKEVRLKLKEAQRSLDQGKPISYPRQKVRDYLAKWLGVQKLKVKLTTFTNREVVVRTRINPVLGNLLLAQVTTTHVQDFIQTLVDDKLSPSYIGLIFRVLNIALNYAVRLNMIPQNPCKYVTLPRQEKHTYQVLDQQQAKRLLQELQGHKLEWLITLALVTGMRRGELLALHWKDVDLVHGVCRYSILRPFFQEQDINKLIQRPQAVNAVLHCLHLLWKDSRLIISNNLSNVHKLAPGKTMT